MTAIIIISVIILIFAVFLNIKIKAEISYIDGDFFFKVRYLCFTIFPFKEKKGRKKKKEKKSKKAQKLPQETVNNEVAEEKQNDAEKSNETVQTTTDQTEQSQKSKKESLTDKIDKLCDIIEKAKIIWNVSKKHLLNIFKRIYIEELMVDFFIADEDAYKTAMNYGKINAAVYNLINFIRTFFTVTIKTVDIVCDFDSKKSIYNFSTQITVKPSTILSAAFGILFGLLINVNQLIGKNKAKHSSDVKTVSV